MPDQNSGDLLGEGIRSYRNVLYAIVEFRRQMLQAVTQVLERRLDDLKPALGLDIKNLQEWVQYLDPANVNDNVDGSYAIVGWRSQASWREKWMLLAYWKTDEATVAGHAYVTLWLRFPQAAALSLRSKQLSIDWTQIRSEIAVSVALTAPDPDSVRIAFEAAVDKAIALWNLAGGARQFLPIEQAPTDAALGN